MHWECLPEVLEEADFYGSTSQMAGYVKNHAELRRVYMATECEMAANLATEFPQVGVRQNLQHLLPPHAQNQS